MSKRRKYDLKNKRSFIIILVLSIAVIGIFSLFIYKYSKASKIEYVIESGSVLQDIEKNYINVDDDAILKIRWDGSYYLIYNDEKINLGNKVITYNTITGGMKLYGTFYEIASDGKIIENKNETVLANTTDTKFYKLDDREYLLVDNKIYSDDNSIEANNYLLVELDKVGNAKLSNNKINLKTISPTKLVTSKYTFDIANELLNFGQFDIDLKKIIGSTNQYVPESNGDNKEESDSSGNNNVTTPNEEDDNNLNIGTGTGGTGGTGGSAGTGIGTGTAGGPGDVINNNDTGKVPDIGEIMDKVKMTSIIRVVEGITQIDVDYVIYDPYNEYKSVYVEIISSGKAEVVYLSKLDTHITLNNLNANTDYRLNFMYTTSKVNDGTGESELVPYTFESFDLKTKMPEYSISVYKISKVYNKLTYKVNLQSGFSISKINTNLSFDYEDINPETGESSVKTASIDDSIDITDISSGYVLGDFNISYYEIDSDTLLKLTVKNVVQGDVELPVNVTYTFRFGR